VGVIDDILKPQMPDQLYHYTSFGGLLGIVQSKSMWASDIHYLNDEQEFEFGLATLRDVIRENETRVAKESDRDLLRVLAAQMDHVVATNVLVASFSEVDDLLSQWRGYCPNGKGVSIGFFASDLSRAAELQHFRLVKVAYGTDIARKVATELVANALSMDVHGGLEALRGVAEYFALQVSLIGPALKHDAFSEEREWRLVSPLMATQKPELKVRETSGRLVPYLNFGLSGRRGRLRLSHVRVGPASDRTRAYDGTRHTLEIFNVECSDVRRSAVPYRE